MFQVFFPRSARVFVWGYMAATFLLPDMAAAQSSSVSGKLPSLVRVGQTVWVTTVDGRHVDGKIASVSALELVVENDAPLTRLRWSEVGMLETDTQDPIMDGLAKGAIIGGLSGGIGAAVIMSSICNGCDNGSDAMRFAIVGAGIGAGVGALVDVSRHRRRQVYRGSPSVSVVPVLVPRTVAISGVVRW